MGKIRRGNYVFLTWKGDHEPEHVHVYRKGRLVVKWDLERGRAMKGQADRRVQRLIAELRAEGQLKIRAVQANARKRAFDLSTSTGALSMPFARLRLRPQPEDPVVEVFVDPELGNEAFTYRLASGGEDSVHLDAVLEYHRDPETMRRLIVYDLTLEAQRRVHDSGLSKREIIRRLGTSASQLYRLLDPTNTRKSVDRLIALLQVLDCEVELVVRQRGA